jgi:hypothetical protein
VEGQSAALATGAISNGARLPRVSHAESDRTFRALGRRVGIRRRARPTILRPPLRTRHAYPAIRAAIAKCAARTDYRVIHASIQSNRVHLLVEADDKLALTRGMQGFAIAS